MELIYFNIIRGSMKNKILKFIKNIFYKERYFKVFEKEKKSKLFVALFAYTIIVFLQIIYLYLFFKNKEISDSFYNQSNYYEINNSFISPNYSQLIIFIFPLPYFIFVIYCLISFLNKK